MLHYYPVTDSTNDDARRLALGGAPERTIVLADEQRAGRGRLGRRWIAPRGSSLLLSIIFERSVPSVALTALCAVAIVDAIQVVAGLQARIKWPNDVMIDAKKVCGVLTEVLSRDERTLTAVGVGLNVNLDPASAGLPPTATSLSAETGRPLDRSVILDAVLRNIDSSLVLDDQALESSVRGRWGELLWRRWQAVRVDQDGPTLYGVIEGLSPSGALQLRAPNGELLHVAVGDVGLI